MISRDDHKGHFVIVSSEVVRNKDISLASRGLLAFILSHPNDWNFTREALAAATGATQYEIRKCLKELTDAGYCYCTRTPRKDGKGTKWQLNFTEVRLVENQPNVNQPNVNQPNVNRPVIEECIKEECINEVSIKKNISIITDLNTSNRRKEKFDDFNNEIFEGLDDILKNNTKES
ncbi:MAG: helix-turn-helix domain-containing protein [Bacteroidales bacterium]|nr:helix-turn-helix domain-containing protein [Bacteroidales bacterium]